MTATSTERRTAAWGTTDYGIVFKVTGKGTFTILHAFDLNRWCEPTTPGWFWGKTATSTERLLTAALWDMGMYSKSLRGELLTSLHSFTPASDGGTPQGGLVQATDGNFYGGGYLGGSKGDGTIFRITPGGTFSTRLQLRLAPPVVFP